MKYEWGKYTWYLFHALAEKINDTHFNKAYTKIISWVKLICLHLPCPYCAEHASMLLNKYSLLQPHSQSTTERFNNEKNIC